MVLNQGGYHSTWFLLEVFVNRIFYIYTVQCSFLLLTTDLPSYFDRHPLLLHGMLHVHAVGNHSRLRHRGQHCQKRRIHESQAGNNDCAGAPPVKLHEMSRNYLVITINCPIF